MLATLKRQLRRIREQIRDSAVEDAIEPDGLTEGERIAALTRIRVESWMETGFMAGSSADEIWQRAHELAISKCGGRKSCWDRMSISAPTQEMSDAPRPNDSRRGG